MAQEAKDGNNRSGSAVNREVENFVRTLTAEHRMLIVLKSQLYESTWEPMLEDLRSRLAGKPYIFKLAGRIEQDIERIQQIKRFEEEHGVDLADYVNSVD